MVLTKRYYEEDDETALPRNIANFKAFENAISLDITMGGSTNTVLHLLAAAHEAKVDFTMDDMDRLSRSVPNLSKVAPATQLYHMEDVHRAGGVFRILGELERGGMLHTECNTVHAKTMGEALERYLDKVNGCIRDVENAYSKDGGLAVLYGNIAEDGCIVKTAGVDEHILTFEGRARVYESQDDAVTAILADQIVEGDIVVILYEGPKGGPGMQEMLYPTSYLKSKGLGKACALITDGRFSGGTSGLSIGHASPEAAEGGAIGLVEEGDAIDIDIPNRKISLRISDDELQQRRVAMDAKGRNVTQALRAYAAMATSASKGAVRDVSQVEK
ncbi:UNVERIFIED_CONTAM: hypothetical protein GTU68_019963 [Idotea baltica]|nr:hypothetical protein [Idotea baltica]